MENKCKDCCYYNVITDTLGYCDNFKTLSLQVKAEQTNMKCFANEPEDVKGFDDVFFYNKLVERLHQRELEFTYTRNREKSALANNDYYRCLVYDETAKSMLDEIKFLKQTIVEYQKQVQNG